LCYGFTVPNNQLPSHVARKTIFCNARSVRASKVFIIS
jgi:hypothetical protein